MDEILEQTDEKSDIAEVIKRERKFLDEKIHSYTKTEKELMVATNLSKLQEIFKDLSVENRAIVDKTIESVAFMTVELQDLEKTITANGLIEEYRNGAYQKGTKVSSLANNYNSIKKTYLNDVKFLTALINFENSNGDNDSLMDFIKSKG